MEQMDGATLGNQLLRLGLISAEQLAEVREEAGAQNPPPEEMLRILERKSYLTPWQTAKVMKGDTTGYVLGGYRLLYKVASGSFGRVFRAEEPQTGRIVAVKVLRRRWSEDQAHIDLFKREGKVGMSLKHPNIVEILAMSHDAAAGQYYIVMEFVEGGNLREILQIRKKLTVGEALRVLEDSASALAYAYSRGITHRDLKLTNILISSQGAAKLVDFGLAQVYQKMGQEQMDKVERTVDYAGLERATRVPHGDVRSDIYFLGCILYECLVGRPPLEMSRDRNARMQKHRFDNVQPLTPDDIDAPPSVFLLVENMMAMDPLRRYQTPSQLLDAVRKARAEVDGKATGQPAAAPTQRSLFIVEGDVRLQGPLRDKFKELGFRVFLAADPMRALERFRQQPFDALIVDAGSTTEEGLFVFDNILNEAIQKKIPCAGVLVLSEEQAAWKGRVMARANAVVLVRPVTMKQLYRSLQGMLPA